MLKRYLVMSVLAASFAGAAVSAQSPSTPPQQPPATERPEATEGQDTQTPQRPAMGATTTLSGCVYKEEDIAGRTPNPAERAGVLEDYILAEVKPSSESPSATPGAVGTSGSTGQMYKLEQIADERLKSFVGKRVEVVGRIDAEAGDAAANRAEGATAGRGDASAGPDQLNLAEFEVSEIRGVAGECPAKPSGQR
ncbi:MAG: hypothetical protein ACREUZ_14185 [Burkholderiales bacterium]